MGRQTKSRENEIERSFLYIRFAFDLDHPFMIARVGKGGGAVTSPHHHVELLTAT